MNFKDDLLDDLQVFFDTDEFGQVVSYYINEDEPITFSSQLFDDESELTDTMVSKMVYNKDYLPNISKEGFFVINNNKYGILAFTLDEEKLLMQVMLQKGMI